MTQDIHYFRGKKLFMNCCRSRIANCSVTFVAEDSKCEMPGFMHEYNSVHKCASVTESAK